VSLEACAQPCAVSGAPCPRAWPISGAPLPGSTGKQSRFQLLGILLFLRENITKFVRPRARFTSGIHGLKCTDASRSRHCGRGRTRACWRSVHGTRQGFIHGTFVSRVFPTPPWYAEEAESTGRFCLDLHDYLSTHRPRPRILSPLSCAFSVYPVHARPLVSRKYAWYTGPHLCAGIGGLVSGGGDGC
jgi:hypothetical protein